MKPHTLPVKRRPVQKGIFRRLSAVTRRKQHVAATADADSDFDDGSSKISRALTIIFLIHIVAIGLIFVHRNFLDSNAPEEVKAAAAATVVPGKELPAVAPAAPRRQDLPRLSTGEKPYIVRAGDNYTRIAASLGVDESDLRLVNGHTDITPGTLLKIPPQRPAVAEPVPAVASLDETSTTHDDLSDGLVDAIDVTNAPRAVLVRGNGNKAATAEQPKAAATSPKASAASGKTHVVKSGESIWRIATRYKVSPQALMKANNISDERKVKIGTSLTIP